MGSYRGGFRGWGLTVLSIFSSLAQISSVLRGLEGEG
jgi:hypothetical protein